MSMHRRLMMNTALILGGMNIAQAVVCWSWSALTIGVLLLIIAGLSRELIEAEKTAKGASDNA